MDGLYAVVLAGGRGSRFWPLSRRSRPKQCVSIGGRDAALTQTVERLLGMLPIDRILVATGRDMVDAVRALLPALPAENLLVEPWGRNTAPCIGLAAVEIGKRCTGAVMAVFPSDHRVGDPEALNRAILAGAEAAKATNAFVTLGVKPTRPETGFGYLEVGPEVGTWRDEPVMRVERFTEKPGPEAAEAFLSGGRHLWNAGMFVFTVEGLRDAFRAFLPRTSEALERVAQNPQALEKEWGNMDATSIDYGVMERSRHILVVPCDPDWSDLGSWAAAGDEMPKVPGGRGNAVRVIAKDSSGCIVHAPTKTVVLLGLEDTVVVDTEDAILVMKSDRSAQVGTVVRELEAADLDELT